MFLSWMRARGRSVGGWQKYRNFVPNAGPRLKMRHSPPSDRSSYAAWAPPSLDPLGNREKALSRIRREFERLHGASRSVPVLALAPGLDDEECELGLGRAAHSLGGNPPDFRPIECWRQGKEHRPVLRECSRPVTARRHPIPR